MSTVKTRTISPNAETNIETALAILENTTGNIYYVSISGADTNDGLSWEKAFRTIIYAVSQCTPLNGDIIYVATGTYDETVNTTSGVICNVAGVSIIGAGEAPSDVVIQNTNSDGIGSVFTITANQVILRNLYVQKNDSTSNANIVIVVNGAALVILDDVVIEVEHNNATGLKWTGTSVAGIYKGGLKNQAIIFSDLGVGTGIDYDNCTHMLVQDANLFILDIGVKLRANARNVIIKGTVGIENVSTGIHIYSGASNNVLDCLIANATTDIIDNSGNATNNPHSSLTHIHDSIEHIEKYTGKIWYVDGTNGSDTNSGENPHEAFATIGNALNNMSEGDAVTVRTGDYYEDNIQLNQIGTEIWGEIGTVIHTTTTTGLTISARDCRVKEIILSTIGQTAIDLQGNYCVLENITCIAPSIGISISGRDNRLKDVLIAIPTTTGLDVNGPYNWARNVFVIGNELATRGFYLSTSNADQNIFEMCNSIGNATAGYETVAGANLNSFIKCTSGSGDGVRVDAGTNNFWDIVEVATTEHHEHMYPISDGEGTAGIQITVDNTATDDSPDARSDRWYWGDTVAIIEPNTLTSIWFSVGIYIYATTTGKVLQWQIWFPDGKINSARNGGNAWSYSQTVITVSDGSIFQVNDLVWLTSTSHPDGEIQKITNIAGNVITLASETRFSGNTGIRYNHVGGEVMYLVYRSTDPRYMPFEGGYSAGSAKEGFRTLWHNERELAPNSAMIIRILNALDALDVEFDVSALYYDL